MAAAHTNGADWIIRFLKDKGPSLSSAIVERLVSENGMKPEAARQRVSRSVGRGSIERIRGIQFPHRESFLFLKEDHTGAALIEPLWKACTFRKPELIFHE
jgi:hypothetical protein